MATLSKDQELLSALAAGKLPANIPAEGEAAPELRALAQQLHDVHALALCLGRGELTLPEEIRSRGPLVGSLKALHGALRHLSWQAQRVAEGDLSHHVDFMGDFAAAFNEMVRQLAQRHQMEVQLRQAQKHEAVGKLAGGLAHEINTPAQFVSGDIQFMTESIETLLGLLATYRTVLVDLGESPLTAEARERLGSAEAVAEVDYLREEVPKAATSAREGIERIAKIVSALKEFACPDLRDKSLVDLNRALQATLIVAESQYREVAALETEYSEIPPVLCQASDINEIFLALISNAVHAIEDAGRGSHGLIRVSTRVDGKGVRIEVSDNGCGIPATIADRIFDPFFTTKAVGRGSGQGLAVARSVIQEGHAGRLTVESREGEGASFSIWLPAE